MQTNFSETQLQDPLIREADDILRHCVHCGFCTATCPTFVVLGDELDSPRGRIYLIKDMLEGGATPSEDVVKHVDRCLSCLSCTTTCPSGVDYMHLVDMARARIEDSFDRPIQDKLFRSLLAFVIPRPAIFRLALVGAWFARPFRNLLPGSLGAMLSLAPPSINGPSPIDGAQTFRAQGTRRKRVALMTGCAQQVLAPSINEATVRILTRHGCDVVVAEGAGCCGALEHHMGKVDGSHAAAKRNIEAWERVDDLDAVIINASGCGTTVKDYSHMFKDDPDWADRAKRISALCQDVTEILHDLSLNQPVQKPNITVAYHSACSMQHGQKITQIPKDLLNQAGFQVLSPAEGHLCCGSAGTYNMTQPELAATLGRRKAGHLDATGADVVAAGNIGCQMQIDLYGNLPVVHTVELLDWATGGPKPAQLG
ncbi:MAG: glycolate oxidase subunit GlcF [Rhodospirillales bacterium]|jgi:glycolate oxidase iron-sulfur subunit|nr:glycolate oxidase subunit GlcF [Rhodospirillales bacterium]MBT4041509.1 glycolate oxidase subunit GlcF [Rhodospirillales bacterium]MBT4627514.1 glycolate oxidase subunit GlcF [Rhodospirillales bacterium]MBT5352916.1 glycolate oxidase subunit GlcF [Rhodospirillales bacterium]MBT5520210.1 glycolate oxidase subunit GlcF [Rhodospirillales bacterium]